MNRCKNLLILRFLLNLLRFYGAKERNFYRVQNYCFFVNPTIADFMKKYTIIKHHSKECC